MKTVYALTVICASVSFVGCSGTVSDNPVEVQETQTPVKTMLEDVAKTGELGSGAMEIRDALEQMKASGDAKADELLSDLDELERMATPAAIKTKAQQMADKL
jgi:hypothetical protein